MPDMIFPPRPVLIIDDEPMILDAMTVSLEIAGFTNIVVCPDSRDVERLLDEHLYSAITLDLIMPGISGAELLPLIRERQPDASVIIVTGTNDVDTAVNLMKAGAFDFLLKPINKARLVTSLNHAIENQEIRQVNSSLRQNVLSGDDHPGEAFSSILTSDGKMKGLFRYIEAIAGTSLPVLVTGETGVGKELLARSVHQASGRSGRFVPVNTAGLDDHLFSDSLFGHRKGAFTGAATDRKGMVEYAAAGTLFLDEIGDLSPETQIKLLRLLQEREYYPLGNDVPVKTDTRFVFATNRNLEDMVRQKEFRQDLYYRLRSHRVRIPALRERPGDIPRLLYHFLEQASVELDRSAPEPAEDLFEGLRQYSFPGNVRELQGLVFDAVIRLENGPLTLSDFDPDIRDNIGLNHRKQTVSPESPPSDDTDNLFGYFDNLPPLKRATGDLIQEALNRSEGNQTEAAKALGITRSALNKRLTRGTSGET